MTRLYYYARLQLTRAAVWSRQILDDERGATVAEYALVLVLVAVALISVLGELGEALQNRIDDVIKKLPSITP